MFCFFFPLILPPVENSNQWKINTFKRDELAMIMTQKRKQTFGILLIWKWWGLPANSGSAELTTITSCAFVLFSSFCFSFFFANVIHLTTILSLNVLSLVALGSDEERPTGPCSPVDSGWVSNLATNTLKSGFHRRFLRLAELCTF